MAPYKTYFSLYNVFLLNTTELIWFEPLDGKAAPKRGDARQAEGDAKPVYTVQCPQSLLLMKTEPYYIKATSLLHEAVSTQDSAAAHFHVDPH